MNKEDFKKNVLPYILIVVGVLLVKNFIVTPVRVSGVSMDATLKGGDVMILNRLSYLFAKIDRGDIVVVDIEDSKLIKRVIAIPGDSIHALENVLYINDKAYQEAYLDDGIVTDDFSLENVSGKSTIPEGMYFVMGDNRQQSLDSRVFGLVPKKKILGRASLTIFPFNRVAINK